MSYVNVNGVWKEETNKYVNVNGVWKTCSSEYVNVNGVWKDTSQKLAYSYNANTLVSPTSSWGTDGFTFGGKGGSSDDSYTSIFYVGPVTMNLNDTLQYEYTLTDSKYGSSTVSDGYVYLACMLTGYTSTTWYHRTGGTFTSKIAYGPSDGFKTNLNFILYGRNYRYPQCTIHAVYLNGKNLLRQ